jgi:hypothetical protein
MIDGRSCSPFDSTPGGAKRAYLRRPKTFFVALRSPTEVSLSMDLWDGSMGVRIRGLAVEAGECPWVSLGDLLVGDVERELVGVTFIADPDEGLGPCGLDPLLNPDIIHYDEVTTPEADERNPGERGLNHRCEIIWSRSRKIKLEWAQLLSFAQWAWLYPSGTAPAHRRSPIAFVITDVDDLLDGHSLLFPPITFPRLDER